MVRITDRISDRLDRWIMDMHRGDDLAEGLEEIDEEIDFGVVCVWCRGHPAWPCDEWQRAASRIAERRMEQGEGRRGRPSI